MRIDRVPWFFLLLSWIFIAAASLAPTASTAETCAGNHAFELLDRGDDESGIGGTGVSEGRRDSRGFGPITRLGDDDDASGVGGTGIFGHITRSDGLCVNGFEISVPAELVIEGSDGLPTENALAVGNLVWIRAVAQDGQLVARQITLFPEGSALTEALIERVLRRGAGLGYLSIEGIVAGSRARPRLGGFEVDLGAETERAAREGLRPGSRVRLGGHLTSDGFFRVARPPWLDRPGRDGSERGRPPLRDVNKPDDAQLKPSPRAPSRDRMPPSIERPEHPQPLDRPELLDRPQPPDRPEPLNRPQPLDRPAPPSIERPTHGR